MVRLLSTIVLILAIILFPPAVLALVSNNAVPGDSTYSIKRFLEDGIYTIASLNPGEADDAKKRFEEIKKRLEEEKKSHSQKSQTNEDKKEENKDENVEKKEEKREEIQKTNAKESVTSPKKEINRD